LALPPRLRRERLPQGQERLERERREASEHFRITRFFVRRGC
jgi:hypothetical protein